jgi:hypothetical protein
MKILVSTICFINRNKKGAEIYATFAKRLIDDIMNKTPYDIMVTTNEVEHFKDDIEKYEDRVIIREELLEKHKLVVGVFNQMLKFFSIKNIDQKYNWVLYLDCDAGLTGLWDIKEINTSIKSWESDGYDMVATRTDAILINELKDHEDKVEKHKIKIKENPSNTFFEGNLFSNKFIFYNVSTDGGPLEWFDSVLPSEHVLLLKNNEKLSKMCKNFEDFCYKFESQDVNRIQTVDMEAFEIGVSAKLAGYKTVDFGNYGLYHVFKVACNHNNWEKVKY